jgi:hypothetical protein
VEPWQGIKKETLTVELASQPLTGEGVHRAEVKVDGQALIIMLRKV